MLKNKKGIEISFSWLFAIIVGAFIIFLAIYGSIRVLNMGRELTSAETSAEIGVLLNPLETGFESGRVTLLKMPKETRIQNRCESEGSFGRQGIVVSQKSFGEWAKADIDVGFFNKYLFSDYNLEGKEFYIFSKPFEFPFKVSDIVYITSSEDKYCFIESTSFPDRIKEELNDLNQGNIYIGRENCPEGSINVCFNSYNPSMNCDIKVDYGGKTVEKDNELMYFITDSLMYGAIFSEPLIYECQIKRLMKRAEKLSGLYQNKLNRLIQEGCFINFELSSFSSMLSNIESSEELIGAFIESERINEGNRRSIGSRCELW
ncbi:hypothetical protein K0A97_01495 [Patescibacteria group bacterium]|nr:hypothetical protein [Patescibacteria group bacterium]